MRVPRIFCSDALAADSELRLEAGPSQHLVRVLRLGVGDALILFDGRGGEYPATITEADKRATVVTTGPHNPVERESPLQVHLGIGISRGERMDWIVQKATELGVTSIAPLHSERTEVRLKGEREARKQLHWQQIANSACEQCQRNRVPELHSPASLDAWLNSVNAEAKFVLHHRAGPLRSDTQPPTTVALLVGPEGGLSDDEIRAAERHGFQSLQLGPRVLRTETAPLVALSLLQARWGDLSAN